MYSQTRSSLTSGRERTIKNLKRIPKPPLSAAFNKVEEKLEQERHKEEVRAQEPDPLDCHPSLIPRKPHTWLIISGTVNSNDNEKHIFYNIIEDHYYVRFVPELQNKYVAGCYQGWVFLWDRCTRDCSILNIMTMEKIQLPPLLRTPCPPMFLAHTHCVMSSSKMDRSCRVILFENEKFETGYRKFRSCHIGDSEFINGEMTNRDGCIRDLINFKEKLYAVTTPNFNLIASDFSEPGLRHQQVISGQSLINLVYDGFEEHIHLVESCEDLLLIVMSHCDFQISSVKIFKADFSIGEWVKLETLGDRVLFLGSVNNSFSSPASALGMKGNVVYWVRMFADFNWSSTQRHLYMYDIEDKSISMSLPVPIVESCSSLSWVSFPMTCNEEKKLERLHVQQGKAITESTKLQIEQRKPQKREETERLGNNNIFRNESLWKDLPNDLLIEIFSYLFAGDRVAFRLVCRSWYSVSPSSRSSKQCLLTLKNSDCFSPFLMCPGNKKYHPIFGELFSTGFLDIPEARVRAARDGWFLMDNCSRELFFINPFTKAEIKLPDCNVRYYHSVFFSAPPISADCLVVVAAARRSRNTHAICFMRIEDEDWTCFDVTQEMLRFSYHFTNCNPVAFKHLFYFLGLKAKLLIFCPKELEVRVIETPKFVFDLKVENGQHYMFESDGKLIAVLVSHDGSSVCTCEWKVSTSKWEILVSLENIMLFVSRPLSLCKRATVRGTGNKIYFPRVVGDKHILFYSIATKRHHTFEMGTSYPDFLDSKFYPQYNGWFMP